MQIKEIIAAIEQFAPLALQETYDNSGLQAGDPEAECTGVLVSLDVTEDVVAEAVEGDCNLIVTHHPPLFHPLRRLSPEDYLGRCIMDAIRQGITIYSAHTNLDNAEDGVCYKMAEKLGLIDVVPMEGGGVLGYLPEPVDSSDFLQRVKDVFRTPCLRHNYPLARPIMSVALMGGAGQGALEEALRQGADAFLTGEMSYHRMAGLEQRIQLAVTGHHESERCAVELLAQIVAEAAPDLSVEEALSNTNPVQYLT